ncbi:MAG: CotH kinase family protein, partial [Spirochaetales bacterium]|nr:CotH kinase family protein [Spirochaetales bacterium]
MLKSKTITIVGCIALVVMLVLAVLIWVGKAAYGRNSTNEMGYEAFFDKSYVHTIDIEIDDWDGFIASATSEEYVVCNVTIDGEKIKSVGIRAKGNTSLSSVASQGSEKYSFKIEFDHFVDGRLYRGLDKLSLNNLIYDATMMKDYLAYTLMGEMDVPSSLCSYVEITVNGETWGLYLAVEGVEDSFLERNNMTRGELYKPDSLNFGGGRGNGGGFDIENFRVSDDDSGSSVDTSSMAVPDMSAFGMPADMSSFGMPADMSTDMMSQIFGQGQMPSGDMSSFMGQGQMPGGSMPSGMSGMPTGDMSSFMGQGQMPSGTTAPATDGTGSFSFNMSDVFSMAGFGGGNFNFGMGNSEVKLQYIDDNLDSYATIFESAKTVLTKKDKERLVEALRKLNSGEDIENTVYTDEVINYLAVHDFLQNSDSYTGMMVHNYYLYEENGQLAIIPWDYNLAFGGMNGSDGTTLVNSPIDSPVANGNASDRPLIAWIFNDCEALAQYHETYSRFVSEYIESGWLKAEIDRVYKMIRPYVEADENSFYSAEEFDVAIENLQAYCSLRGQSIRGQLDGTIPSTSNGQRNASTLVNGSSVNVSAMGSMGGRGGFGGGGNGFGGGDSSSRSFSRESSRDSSQSSMTSASDFAVQRSSSSQSSTGSQTGGRSSTGSRPSTGGGSSGRSFTGGSSAGGSSMGGSVSAPDSAGATAGRSMPEGMNMPSDFSAWGGRAGSSAPRTSWLEV